MARKPVLIVGPPGFDQVANLSVQPQDAVHDAALFKPLLFRQHFSSCLVPQLVDQCGTGHLGAPDLIPVGRPRCGQHAAALLFDSVVVVQQGIGWGHLG